VGSTIAGAAATAALTLYFVATPTGWITALAFGVAAAGGSFVAGKSLKSLYTASDQKVDFVSGLGIDRLCR